MSGNGEQEPGAKLCMEEIDASLKRFNCVLLFQQVLVNGVPASNSFVVQKKQPQIIQPPEKKGILSNFLGNVLRRKP